MKSKTKRVRVQRFKGVYQMESTRNRYQGKPDLCFYINYRDQAGKLKWEKIGWRSEGYTAQNAASVRADRMKAIRHGEILIDPKKNGLTFSQMWAEYKPWIEANHRKPADSISLYSKHLADRFGDMPLSQITPKHLEDLKSDMLKQGYSESTVVHVLAFCRQLFNKANDWKLWRGENPTKTVKFPRPNNKRERFLTHEEAHELLEALEHVPQVRSITLVSLHTGMRAGEIFALMWNHLDFDNDLIHIADPKSGRARKVPMSGTVKQHLQDLGKGEPGEYVFQARGGGKVKEVSSTFGRIIERLGWNSGIDDRRQRVTFHTLRHTFASWLAMQGTPILTIKELLGHQTLAMTERYSHLAPDVKHQAVMQIDEGFQASQQSSPD